MTRHVYDSASIAYKEGTAETPRTDKHFTTFVMDFTSQRQVTPKAAPRAGKFGTKTMNSGGKPAGYASTGLVRGDQDG